MEKIYLLVALFAAVVVSGCTGQGYPDSPGLQPADSDDVSFSFTGFEDEGELVLRMRHTGMRSVNASGIYVIREDGRETCSENGTIIDPQGSFNCPTGMEFPSEGGGTSVLLLYRKAGLEWNYTCDPSEGEDTC